MMCTSFFTSRAAGSKIALYFLRLFVCWLVYISTLSTCTIITSRTLLPCNFTLVDLMAAMNTGVATTRVTGSSFNTVQTWVLPKGPTLEEWYYHFWFIVRNFHQWFCIHAPSTPFRCLDCLFTELCFDLCCIIIAAHLEGMKETNTSCLIAAPIIQVAGCVRE